MDGLRWVSLALYAIAFGTSIVFGVRYLIAREFMPYHREVVGTPWDQLDGRVRQLIFVLLKLVGAGMVSVGLAGLFLLAVPFRDGALWPNFAMISMAAVMGGASVFATTYLKRETKAETPIIPAVASMVLPTSAFVLRLLG